MQKITLITFLIFISNSLFCLDKITVISHRGATKLAPENTIPAFELAVQMGARALEVDVRETRDGHFVIMHDSRVNRTTDGRGWVRGMTLKQIKSLDAGKWFGLYEFEGDKVRVPTLAEVAKRFEGRAILDIDFKSGSAERLTQYLEKHQVLGKYATLIFNKKRDGRNDFENFHDDPRYHYRRSFWRSSDLNNPRKNKSGLWAVRWSSFSNQNILKIREKNMTPFVHALGENLSPKKIQQVIEAKAPFIMVDDLTKVITELKRRDALQTCVFDINLNCTP